MDPRFRGDDGQRQDRPLATTLEVRGRLVLAGLDAAAAAAGLHPGLPLADARAILPGLETVAADPPGETEALGRLAGWCGRYSPWTTPETPVSKTSTPRAGAGAGGRAGDRAGDRADDGAGAIWLDVGGCAHLFGGEAALLADLVGRLEAAGYAARAGLADTPGAAWAAARFAPDVAAARFAPGGAAARFAPGGAAARLAPEKTADGPGWTIVPEGGARGFLAPLPVAALRIAPETATALDALGLRSIGAVAGLPRASLAARFGGAIAARLDAALGVVGEPLSPDAPAAPDFARLGFAEPIGRADDIAAALDHLLARLARGLARRRRGARRLVLTLFEPNGAFHRLAVGTSRPSRDTSHLARLFAEPLAGLQIAFGVESMTLAAPETERQGAAQARLEDAGADLRGGHRGEGGGEGGGEGEDEGAGALIDRLANRLGAARVVRPAARESHIPERAVVFRPALRAAARSPALRAAARTDAAWPASPRPLRLLIRPEPIEAVAPIPDDPPVMFRWRRVLHRVARAEGPERIAPEWWRAPEVEDAAVLRDYYRIEDTEGRRFWLYREGLYRPGTTPAWFLHGLFG